MAPTHTTSFSASSRAATQYARSAYLLTGAFFGIFMAFNTAQGLETNIVTNSKLAHASLAILYACFTVVSTVAPVMVQRCGPKLTMIIGASPYAFLIGSFLAKKETYAISIPVFAAVGIGGATLWAAEGVYLGRCAIYHAGVNGEKEEDVTSRFNGVFYSSFQFTGGTGMVLASLIYTNVDNQELAKTVLFSVMLGITCIGLALFCTLREVKPLVNAEEEQPLAITNGTEINSGFGGRTSFEAKAGALPMISLSATLKQAFCSAPMAFLVPIIFYNGMSLAFFFSDYRLFYADVKEDGVYREKRLISSDFVGFVTATFYFTDSLFSLVFGKLASIIGRRGVAVIAFCSHAAFYVMLIVLKELNVLEHESTAAYIVVFFLPVLFGIGDSVWMSQIPAILQSPAYLPGDNDRDTAMSNLKLWQSLGLAVQFLIGVHVELKYTIEISIVLGVLLLSAGCMLYSSIKVRSIDSDLFNRRSTRGTGSGDDSYDNPTYL
eukprot:gb/GECG01008351.1/.p1 GENE.gb/GECG01008351.1/~~gb/GECG01008351.1/.p1  ORF type:complete len:493 (+),score=41.16 gb/GECG01008351.1/:1-1479(+)